MNISALLCDSNEFKSKALTTVQGRSGSYHQSPTARAEHSRPDRAIASKMSLSVLLCGPENWEGAVVTTLPDVLDLECRSSKVPLPSHLNRKQSQRRRKKQRNGVRSNVRAKSQRQRPNPGEGTLTGLRQRLVALQEQHYRRRTLQVTVKDHLPTDAFGLMTTYLRVLQNNISNSCSLEVGQQDYFFSRVHPSMKQLANDAGAGVPDFVINEWHVFRRAFMHRACVVTSTRALTILEAADEEDDDNNNSGNSEDETRIRQICGRGRGCVLETILEMSGKPTSATLAAMAPHASSDKQLEEWEDVERVAWYVRKLVYFDASALVVHEEVSFQSCSVAAAAAAAALWG